MNSPLSITYTMNFVEVFQKDTTITCQEIATRTEEPGKVVFRLYFAKYLPHSCKHLPITFMICIHEVYHIST